ncbi:related to NAD-dependent histone deacetylases [Ramularia collo-cygni]|uniref:Related to NAD-dependent histone deacetylases n=1 Tax=Ramularia collo-cygni TaxID=112498 RepID=A0A2D3VK60_9PEZI|nr:related to NAD-dependent histone deacetylases [Ramularia collo-cygni]CZT22704.1 related to NAD-dependent histone deacetylases [Ramularia collo-cygni]
MSSSTSSDAPLSAAPSSPLSSPPSSRSSSPLSERLDSPSPPPSDDAMLRARRNYPSPPASQQTSTSGSPIPDGMDSSASAGKDGQPPAKRRRISTKERTTEHLDLHKIRPGDELDDEQKEQLERVMHVLHRRQKIVVIAGAGISVSAGIPDFRSSGGLFRSLKEEYNLKGSGKNLFDASVYRDDNSTSSFHDMVSTMSKLTKGAKPTAFHHMLATIAQEDRLLRLYSQNVDGIDTSLEPLRTCTPLAKEEGKWPRTVQLHGGLEKMVCSKCHELSDLDPELFDGPVAPLCPRCEEINDIRTNHEGKRSHGIGRLRPRMVLYNEHNPDDEAIGTVTKEDLRKRPDAVIVVGTTLKVPGVRRIVREMCATVRDRRGGVTIWINNDAPPVSKDLEDCWDIVVKGTSDEIAKYAAMRRWDDPVLSEDYTEVSDESARKVTAQALHVRLPSKSPPHAAWQSLPSERHLNNSFKPPLPTDTPPRKIMEHGPSDWSPMVTPRRSIIPSIEHDSFVTEDSITVAHTDTIPVAMGLLTPSKSQRNSPDKKVQPISINDKLKNFTKSKSAATKAKGSKKAVPAKKSNVKFVKPPLSQVKAKANAKSKTKPKSQQAPAAKPLTNSFKSSKSASTAARLSKSDPQSPSKLRQVSNMSSSSPMEAVSPQDARNNTSPATSLEEFANEKSITGRKRMRIETLVH